MFNFFDKFSFNISQLKIEKLLTFKKIFFYVYKELDCMRFIHNTIKSLCQGITVALF